MTDKSLNWPGSTVTKRAYSVSLNLLGNLPQHIYLRGVCITLNKSKSVKEILIELDLIKRF